MMPSASRPEKKSRVAEVQPVDPDDVAMTDASLVETQPDLPEEWEETQPVEGTSILEVRLCAPNNHPKLNTLQDPL
jgi:hypothetical protein